MINEPRSGPPKSSSPLPPSIEEDGWGEILVKSEGKKIKFRDVVLLPEKALPWDWKWSDDEGMDHSPGIREIDLDHYILSHSPFPHTVILTTGRFWSSPGSSEQETVPPRSRHKGSLYSRDSRGN